MIYLIIATIPGAIGGYLLQEQAASTFRSPQLIGVTLIVMGIILWLVDKLVTSGVCSVRCADRLAADRPLSGSCSHSRGIALWSDDDHEPRSPLRP